MTPGVRALSLRSWAPIATLFDIVRFDIVRFDIVVQIIIFKNDYLI
jgi:hypothetical protein